MRKSTIAIVALLVAGFIAVAGNAYLQKKQWSDGVAKLDAWSFNEGNEYNGHIKDIVVGNKDAKVKIFEYADFQCSACATTFPYIHEVVREYGDKIAYIYRNYSLQYHNSSVAAATAALAANNQGYFEKFAEEMFKNQSEWYYSEGQTRDGQFEKYFKTASEEKGDLEKYRADLKSSNIKDKLAVDREFAVRLNLSATPLIYVNKEKFDITTTKESDFKQTLRNRIDAALSESSEAKE
jgi:dsba oxidoreductase